jgi:hypothetical protein
MGTACGGCERVARINADPCSEVTACYASAQGVQLFDAGDEATGEWRPRSVGTLAATWASALTPPAP